MGRPSGLLLRLEGRLVVVIFIIPSQSHPCPRPIDFTQGLDGATHDRGIHPLSPKEPLYVAAFQIKALSQPVDVILEA